MGNLRVLDSHPPFARSRPSTKAKEDAVATSDHSEAVPDEADGGVAQRRSFPRLRSDAINAEDDAGDFTIARAVHVAVNRLKHVAIAAALLASQPAVLGDRPPLKRSQKAIGRLDPVEPVRIQRDQRCQGQIGGNASKAHYMDTLVAGRVLEMDAMIVRPGISLAKRGGEVAVGREDGRRVRKQNLAGVDVCRPEYRAFGCLERGMDKEIATPSAGELGTSSAAGCPPDAQNPRSHAGIQCCAVPIPKRDRAAGDRRGNCRSARIANGKCPASSLSSQHASSDAVLRRYDSRLRPDREVRLLARGDAAAASRPD